MASLSGYGRTSGAVHRIGLHLVWCPKYRRPVLGDRVADRLRSLIQAKCAERGWTVEALEVMPDRVHLFVRTGPDASPALVAHQCKGFTSRVLRAEFPHLRSRLPTLWSKSYLVASVGRVSEAAIRRYIAEQTTRPEKGRP
jgi:REP-associated tyrosine transposase